MTTREAICITLAKLCSLLIMERLTTQEPLSQQAYKALVEAQGKISIILSANEREAA